RSLILPMGHEGAVSAFFPFEGEMPPLSRIRMFGADDRPYIDEDGNPKRNSYLVYQDYRTKEWRIGKNTTERSANADRYLRYDTGTGTANAMIDGFPGTAQVPGEARQSLSPNDFAVQGEPQQSGTFDKNERTRK